MKFTQVLAGAAAGVAAVHADHLSIYTTYDIASNRAEGFETLAAAVEHADLVDALDDKNSALTVFAPTNAAFEKIEDLLPYFLMNNEFSRMQLAHILMYHVLPEEKSRSELSRMEKTLYGVALESNMNKWKLKFTPNNGMNKRRNINNGEAKIEGDEIKAAGATILAIDSVLIPPGTPMDTIADVVGSNLAAALTQANLVSAFTEAHDTVYTVFAPTEMAFKNFFDEYKTSLEEIASDKKASRLLNRVLRSHVVANKAFDSMKVASKKKLKTLGHKIKVEKVLPHIVEADQMTLNGIVHSIDTIIENACTRHLIRRIKKIQEADN